jgi:hypothetical protein
MSDIDHTPDPVLARRFKDWLDQAAPPAAPERLVYAVMDDVERLTRPPRRHPARLETVLQYVALTVVVAIGVAAGSLLSRPLTDGSGSPRPTAVASPPGPSSSPTAAGTTPPPPSLATISRTTIARAPGPSAIAAVDDRLWVATTEGTVVEIDSRSGRELSRTSVGLEPTDIVPFQGLLWLGTGGPDLGWLDPTTHVVGSIAGAGGQWIVIASGSLWVGGRDGFTRIDPATRTAVGAIRVPGRRASDLAAVVGDELWTAVGPSIVRIALPSGDRRGTIPVHPSEIIVTGRGVLAVDAGTLEQLSTPDGILPSPRALLGGLPDPAGAAVVGDRLWLAGSVPGRAGQAIEIDLASDRVVTATSLGGGPRGIAVVGDSLWVSVDTGALARLAIGP